MKDANLVLTNNTALDSGSDGDGSGTDPTSGSGAVVTIPGGGLMGVILALGEPASDPPADGATLDVKVETSPDGGSTWGDGDFCTFRQIDASEIPDDVSAGDPTFIRAAIRYVGLPDADQTGVQVRANITASTTTNWNVHLALVDVNEIRDTWLNDALVA
jgi:hypothetical protein